VISSTHIAIEILLDFFLKNCAGIGISRYLLKKPYHCIPKLNKIQFMQ